MVLLRKSLFRQCLAVILIVLLCGGMLLIYGNHPAPLTEAFIVLTWLVIVAWVGLWIMSLSVLSPLEERMPARAPPPFSL